jgi:hypothetical protein
VSGSMHACLVRWWDTPFSTAGGRGSSASLTGWIIAIVSPWICVWSALQLVSALPLWVHDIHNGCVLQPSPLQQALNHSKIALPWEKWLKLKTVARIIRFCCRGGERDCSTFPLLSLDKGGWSKWWWACTYQLCYGLLL